jgi:anti-sigma factor RsiW
VSDHLGEPTGHERYRGDLAAYALGALEEREAAELQSHLADCEACRMELRWLQPAVDLLPRSVEQLVRPAGLRKRLMAPVRGEARYASGAWMDA